MKIKPLLAFVLALFAGVSCALDISWMIGAFNSNLMVIDGAVTTNASFTPVYEMRLMHLGADWTYSPTLGFSHFRRANPSEQGDAYNHLSEPGKIGSYTPIADDSALSYNDYMVALYEKASGKYYFVSETVGGTGIEPYTLPEIYDDSWMNLFDLDYYPVADNPEQRFYQGAEIPPFCVWLSEHDLVQAHLDGLATNLVNAAFAVGANPMNFTGVSLAVGDVSFGANSITGGLSLVARDGAQNATAVTRLDGDAALSLLSSTTLGGVTSALPASFNLANGTFQSTAGATNATQFLRLKLAVPDVW